jgi:hypothetical protein
MESGAKNNPQAGDRGPSIESHTLPLILFQIPAFKLWFNAKILHLGSIVWGPLDIGGMGATMNFSVDNEGFQCWQKDPQITKSAHFFQGRLYQIRHFPTKITKDTNTY